MFRSHEVLQLRCSLGSKYIYPWSCELSRLFFQWSGKSFRNRRKRASPKTDPWPTTWFTGNRSRIKSFRLRLRANGRNNSQHCWRNNVGFVCTALPTLLGLLTLITHGLQRLVGCILPTMHCRSEHSWELLHPFAHHCQHARTNSQHCCANNVGSCCVRLHTTANTHATLTWSSLSGICYLWIK